MLKRSVCHTALFLSLLIIAAPLARADSSVTGSSGATTGACSNLTGTDPEPPEPPPPTDSVMAHFIQTILSIQ